jgi:uncharacterized protein (DUF1501 family)
MARNWFCGSNDHRVSRRGFLGTAAAASALSAADMTTLDLLQSPVLAAEVKQQQKHVILLWLAGGPSQLETWDPKPGRPTGGPFRAIPTNVPGVQISELMPKLAQRMQHTAVIRSLNTRNADHGGGAAMMETGRAVEQGLPYPDLGAMIANELGRADSQVPDYVSMYTSTEGRRKGTSGFLGSRYAPMFLTEQMVPENIRKLEQLSELDHVQRSDLRAFLANRFAEGRNSSSVSSHNQAYQRVRGIMASEKLFDIEQEPLEMRAKYGPTQFGEQCLIARRLVEAGVPFVKVARAWWDSHGQNFETHLELVTELDHVMSTLIDDLQDRGLLEHTLIITLGEFGRTPGINSSLGRDHFASAWSSSLTGCGVKGGAVYGKTDADGQTVVDGEIKAGELFATIFEAVGIDSKKEYQIGARPVPIVDFGAKPIREVLA